MEKLVKVAIEQLSKSVMIMMASVSWRCCYRAVAIEIIKQRPNGAVAAKDVADFAALVADREDERAMELSEEGAERMLKLVKMAADIVRVESGDK